MSSGFTFGAKTTAAPAFGSTSLTFGGTPAAGQPQPTGLAFGASPAMPGNTPSLFGTPAAVPATTTSLFGTPAAANTGLFGTPPSNTTTSNVPFGGANTFGVTPASTATGLTFGAPVSTPVPVPNFGLNNQQTAAPLGNLGTGLGAPTANVTSTPSFGFGPATSATNATGGLKLATNPVATTAPGLNFGLGGITPASTSLTPATTSQSVGLGGIATSAQAKGSAVTTQKEVPLKDQPLPNEILQTVEAFKDMVKQQKIHSSDISRCSVRDFRRVEEEIDQLSKQLSNVENQLQKHRQIAEKLKYDTAKTVQSVEMAQRTHDTPPGLQYENTAPLKFFLNLADQFEKDMQNLKVQIEAADKYVKNNKNPDTLTPQDLAMGLRRLHETFVALAGRLQSVHSQVEAQKETYINIRKHVLQDNSNPFDKLTQSPQFHVSNAQNAFIHSPPKVATGPTPFSNMTLRTMNDGAAPQHTTPPPAYPGPSTSANAGFASTGFGAPLGGSQPSNTSLFGSRSFVQQSYNNSFQLQKPPTSNKRGKV